MTDRRPLPDIRLDHVLELADGRVVEWEASGRGEPLVWIEGGPGFWAHLARPDVALLAPWFRCHLVNAPGCGRTSPPSDPAEYDLDGHVRFFEEVRAALGLQRVVLAGHSWGGLVALAYAVAHPGRVARLLVIDGYAGVASVDLPAAEAEQEAAIAHLAAHSDPGWLKLALTSIPGFAETEAEQLERYDPCWPLYFADPGGAPARRHVERLRQEARWNIDVGRRWEPEPPIDLRPELDRIACPTLVVAGEHDGFCGPVWARAVAHHITGARLEIIAGVGHTPQYEAADEFRRVVAAWLEAPS
jgi:proline iminopeptidase